MSAKTIHFFKEAVKVNLKPVDKYRSWLETIAQNEHFKINSLSYVFCDDAYLLNLNQDYLQHDTLTDIITFDLSETKQVIEGEIYISIERVHENAGNLAISFELELKRVMAHGLLHLCGYKDKLKIEKQLMTTKENSALAMW